MRRPTCHEKALENTKSVIVDYMSDICVAVGALGTNAANNFSILLKLLANKTLPGKGIRNYFMQAKAAILLSSAEQFRHLTGLEPTFKSLRINC